MEASAMAIPAGLVAVGTSSAAFAPIVAVADLPAGALRRVTVGELDVLIAHTPRGVCATEDRCPHMSAPLSLGSLEDCVVACPLHSGRFDLASGACVQFPTTGGLGADGEYHAPWAPADVPAKPEPTDLKARARAATRVRRLRYFPLRINDGMIEVRLPSST